MSSTRRTGPSPGSLRTHNTLATVGDVLLTAAVTNGGCRGFRRPRLPTLGASPPHPPGIEFHRADACHRGDLARAGRSRTDLLRRRPSGRLRECRRASGDVVRQHPQPDLSDRTPMHRRGPPGSPSAPTTICPTTTSPTSVRGSIEWILAPTRAPPGRGRYSRSSAVGPASCPPSSRPNSAGSAPLSRTTSPS